jgi:outer membrane protein TolC
LFDGGQRQANQALAQAHYVEAVAIYRDKVRQAVREVEEALVNLHSAQSRQTDAQSVTQGYAQSQAAVLALHAQGLANALELEDARRMHLAAQANQIALQLACNRAWIALYRAVGGGGEPTTATFTAK